MPEFRSAINGGSTERIGASSQGAGYDKHIDCVSGKIPLLAQPLPLNEKIYQRALGEILDLRQEDAAKLVLANESISQDQI